ncbi:hypothetical protein Tco_1528874, partial [Tanacetum coccineum]
TYDIDEDDVNSVDEEAVDQKHEDIDENGDEDKVADTLFDDEEVNLEGKNTKESDGSLEYPPGFVPVGVNDESRLDNKDDANAAIDEASSEIQKDENEAHSECRENKKQKDDDNEYSSSGHFKISEAPRSGGSMLGLLEEVVIVGQVMGYKMEGCISNLEEIIGSQGVEDGYR